MSPMAVSDVLATIPDPRSRHGRFHSLPATLGLVVALGQARQLGGEEVGRVVGLDDVGHRPRRQGQPPCQ